METAKQRMTHAASEFVTYYGEAELGVPTNSPKWKILRRLVSGSTTVESYPIGKNAPTGRIGFPSAEAEFTWDARESLTYSLGQDITNPFAITARMESNGSNPSGAGIGNQISVTFVFNENVTSLSVTILGKAASAFPTTDRRNWIALVNVEEGDPEGPVSFTSSFVDISGKGGKRSTTTDGSYVVVDLTAPEFESAAYATTAQVVNAIANKPGYDSYIEDGTLKTLVFTGDLSLTIVDDVQIIEGGSISSVSSNPNAQNVYVEYDSEAGTTTLSFDHPFQTLPLYFIDTSSGGHLVALDASESVGYDSINAQSGGYAVFETGTPATSYTVNSVFASSDLSQVILAIDDPTASAAVGITAEYVAENGVAADPFGNLFGSFTYDISPWTP